MLVDVEGDPPAVQEHHEDGDVLRIEDRVSAAHGKISRWAKAPCLEGV